MTESISVRQVRADDWQRLRALRLRALADAPMAFGTTLATEQARPEQEWRERAAASAAGIDRVTFIAAREHRWVGSVTGLLEPGNSRPRSAVVVGMWVSPEVRRRGVAQALLRAVAVWARGHGADMLQLDVTETNAAAIALYERLGFQPSGTTAPLPHTPTVREIHMQCALADFRGW